MIDCRLTHYLLLGWSVQVHAKMHAQSWWKISNVILVRAGRSTFSAGAEILDGTSGDTLAKDDAGMEADVKVMICAAYSDALSFWIA